MTGTSSRGSHTPEVYAARAAHALEPAGLADRLRLGGPLLAADAALEGVVRRRERLRHGLSAHAGSDTRHRCMQTACMDRINMVT